MKKIYKNYWFICLVLLSFLSCNKDGVEELFSELPAERIAKNNSELLNLLLAEPNGYKGVYFTKNDEFGGFTFFMKFNEDGTVSMTSDFDSDTDIQTSSYDVRQGTATELVFTTRNHIQKVSNPEQEGLIGTGFKGNSVFQYFGSENGEIIFRDVRNRDTGFFVLKPTGFSDFSTESIASVEKLLESRDNFENSPIATAFPLLRINDGTNLQEYALNYDRVRLFSNPTIVNTDGSITSKKFGIVFTEDGLIISPALDVNGVLIDEFTFDDTLNEYVASVDGVSVEIGYSNTPIGPLDIYGFGIEDPGAAFNMRELYKHSGAFINFYENFSNDIANSSFSDLEITDIVMWDLNNGKIPFIEFTTNHGYFWYDIDFVFNEETGIVNMSFTGATNAPNSLTEIMQPLLDLLAPPSGSYVVNTGSYLTYINKTYGLINVDDPTIQISFYGFNY